MRGGPELDSGLQLERTLLGWRRTALAVAVASVAGARFAYADWGAAAVHLGLVGIVGALVAYVASGLRYRAVSRGIGSTATRGEGWPQLGLAVATLGLVVLSVGFVATLG